MVSKIVTAAVAAAAILGGAATANAANFVQSYHATGSIENSANAGTVDYNATGSVNNGTATHSVAPSNDRVGVTSYRIQSVTPYAGR